MTDPAALIAWLERERRFDFPTKVEGVDVVFHLERPSEVDAMRIQRGELPVATHAAYWLGHVRGWTGVVEKCIKGEIVGNNSPVDFSPKLLLAWLVDRRVDLLADIGEQLHNAAIAHLEQRFATQGNSQPS